ncbi:MAG: xanthine dehydrogenase family protein molybdopterin-binding subunit, partial [Gemmobacter sp.]
MTLSRFDRPAGGIGAAQARPNARRLLIGRGRFVDDRVLPRMVHAAFLRSPYAHARIRGIDLEAARAAPGVVAAWDGAEIAADVTPFVGVLTHLAGMRSAPQPALAHGTTHWQGEPLAIVLARSRAEAEDAVALIEADLEPLEPVTDPEAALAPGAAAIHPTLGTNLCLERRIEVGEVDRAFADAAAVAEREFDFARHTGVTLEPRTCL